MVSCLPRMSKRRQCPWAAVRPAVVASLLAFGSAPGFHLVDGFHLGDENATFFVPYERGFVGRVDDPFTTFTWERVNEGSPDSPARPNIYGKELFLTQRCPLMVGPMRDGRYYCTSAAHGYCDRRSGTCFCGVGYQGTDCSACSPTHYAKGGLCYPKKLCLNDCSHAGVCNVEFGICGCDVFRTGEDCSQFACAAKFDALCTSCTNETCVSCAFGHSLAEAANATASSGGSGGAACLPCARFDPRCVSCDHERCLACADPLLMSTRRSGRRETDPSLPLEEATRMLTYALPFGTQDPHFFDDAEDFRIARSPADGDLALNESTVSCRQVASSGGGGAAWSCQPAAASHVVCGHAGTFSFRSPTYQVAEGGNGSLRVEVWRTGGGAYDAWVEVLLEHVTTDASDVTAMAPRGSSAAFTTLAFPKGVISTSFLLTIHEDGVVEPSERFDLVLARPGGGGARLSAQNRAAVTLTDDDAGRTDPAACVAGGGGLYSATAGIYTNFSVSAFVAGNYSNGTVPAAPATAPAAGGEDWVVLLQSAVGERQRGEIEDLGDGNYTVSYRVTAAGAWRVRVLLATAGGLRADHFASPAAFAAPPPHAYDSEISSADEDFDAGNSTAADNNATSFWNASTAASNATGNGNAATGTVGRSVRPILSRIERSVDFAWGSAAPAGSASDFFAVRWEGAVKARTDGRTAFYVSFPQAGASDGAGCFHGLQPNGSASNATEYITAALGWPPSTYWGARNGADDRARLYIDGELVLEVMGAEGSVGSGYANLTAGWLHLLRLEYVERRGAAGIVLEWEPPDAGGNGSNGRETVPTSRLFWLREMRGSPWEVAVAPAEAEASVSEAVGAGLVSATVGVRAHFAVVPRDAFGNPCAETRRTNDSYDGYSGYSGYNGSCDGYFNGSYCEDESYGQGYDFEGFGYYGRSDEGFYYNGSFNGSFAESGASVAAVLWLAVPEDASGDGGFGSVAVTADVWFDRAAGAFRGSYVPQVTGEHWLNVTLWTAGADASHVLGSPFLVTVAAGAASARLSTADGPVLNGTTAGVATNMTIVSRDLFGNRRAGAADRFSAAMLMTDGVGAPEEAAVTQVTPLGNGLYFAEFLPTVSGSYVVSVVLNGAPVGRSPWNGVSVVPAGVSAAASSAWGGGVALAVATVQAAAWVQPRDEFGNDLLAGQSFTATAWLHAPVGSSDSDIPAQITYNVNSSSAFLLTYTPTAVGTNTLAIRINNLHIRGSPFLVTVASGPAAGRNATAAGAALAAATAGVAEFFEVQARDGAGNPTARAATTFNVTLAPFFASSNGTGGATVNVVVGEAVDLGGGRFRASYNATEAGTYALYVTELPDGYDAVGSPFNVTVAPAGAWAPNTIAYWDRQSAGQSRVVLQAVDMWGNLRFAGGDRFRVAWAPEITSETFDSESSWTESADDGVIDGIVSDSGDGTYVIRAASAAERVAADYALLLWVYEPGGLWGRYFAAQDYSAARPWYYKGPVDLDWGLGAPIPPAGEAFSSSTGSSSNSSTNAPTAAEADSSSSWVMPADYFSAVFSGFVLPSHDEDYTFFVLADAGATVQLNVEGSFAIDDLSSAASAVAAAAAGKASAAAAALRELSGSVGLRERQGSFRLRAGQLTSLELRYVHATDAASLRLEWASPSTAREVVPASILFHECFGWSKQLSIWPSAASAPLSTAAGPGLSAAIAGEQSFFVITAHDGYGNVRRAGGDSITAFGRLGGASSFLCDVADLGNGSYNVTYAPTVSGTFALSVLLASVDADLWDLGAAAVEAATGGADVSGSPYRLVVAPGAAAAAGSLASGAGLSFATAGALYNLSQFEVLVGDAYANRRSDSDDAALIGVGFFWAAEESFDGATTAATAAAASAVVTRLGGGRYLVTYNVTKSGNWLLSVSVAGEALPGSPFALRIAPGPSYAASCTCEGCDVLAETLVASKSSFTVKLVARDRWGNALESGGEAWAVALHGEEALGGAGGGRGVATLPVIDLGHARYSVRVRPPAPGRYELRVRLATRRDHENRPPSAGGGGLTAKSYANVQRTGAPLTEQVEAGPLAHDWGSGPVAGSSAADYASVVYSGYITAPASGFDRYGPVPVRYTLELEADDAANAYVNGDLVASAYVAAAAAAAAAGGQGTTSLAPGRLEQLRVEYVERTGLASVALRWKGGVTPLQLVPEAFLYPDASPIGGGGVVPFEAA